MRKIKKKIEIVDMINIISIIIYGILFVYSYENLELGKWILLTVTIYNIFIIYKFKNSQVLCIFMIFVCTYWLYLFFYFFMDIPYSTYMDYQNLENSVFVLRLQSLFFFILVNFINVPKSKVIISQRLERKDNYLIFYGCIMIMIFINIVGLKGNSILKTAYGTEAVGSPLLEYYIIFFIMAYLYSKRNKAKDWLLILINLVYILNLFLHGLRLVSIEIIIMTFILFFDCKIKLKYIIIGSCFCFVFLSMLSTIRIGYLGDWKEVFGVYNGVLQANQGDVFQASAVHVGMARDNIFDIQYRMKAFLGLFQNIFLPSEFQVKETILNQNLGSFRVGGGGLISGYLYVYMGYLGVIIGPIIIAKAINNSFYSNKQMSTLYGIFTLITFARWYPYSIFILIKIGFWLALIYYILRILHSMIIVNRRRG